MCMIGGTKIQGMPKRFQSESSVDLGALPKLLQHCSSVISPILSYKELMSNNTQRVFFQR